MAYDKANSRLTPDARVMVDSTIRTLNLLRTEKLPEQDEAMIWLLAEFVFSCGRADAISEQLQETKDRMRKLTGKKGA